MRGFFAEYWWGAAALCSTLLLGACAAHSAQSPPTAGATGAPDSGAMKARRTDLTAIIRPQSFLDGLATTEREKLISEPFAAGLFVVYMVDERGAARVAEASDLTARGVTREALRAVVEWNLKAKLPGSPSCEPDAISKLPPGNYYQSSRLLLSQEWMDLAAEHRELVIAVPSNDLLLVTCDASLPTIDQLGVAVQNSWPRAAHPVSPVLLEWAGAGFREWKRSGP